MFNPRKQFIPYIKNSINSFQVLRTGALTITFPFGFINCMLSFKVQINQYGDNGGFAEYLLDGYCYGGDERIWVCTHALCITNNSFPNKNVQISFCKNSDGKATISIGSIDTNWNYVHVIVKDILSGWTIPSEDIYNDTTIHFETSDLGTVISVVENPWIGNL